MFDCTIRLRFFVLVMVIVLEYVANWAQLFIS